MSHSAESGAERPSSSSAAGGRGWRRPKDMATGEYARFAAEAKAALGGGADALMREIGEALASGDGGPARRVLAMSARDAEAEAEKLAAENGVSAEACLRHLSILHEIAFRRAHGGFRDRRSNPVPCPGFLPPGPCQVPEGRMSLYAASRRVFGWTVVPAVAGVVPMALLPAFASVAAGRGRAGAISLAAFCAWLACALSAAASFALCRALRGHPCGRRCKRV